MNKESYRMLKKSVLDFFSNDLAGVNPSNPYKLLDFSVSQFGNPSMDCLSGCGLKQPDMVKGEG